MTILSHRPQRTSFAIAFASISSQAWQQPLSSQWIRRTVVVVQRHHQFHLRCCSTSDPPPPSTESRNDSLCQNTTFKYYSFQGHTTSILPTTTTTTATTSTTTTTQPMKTNPNSVTITFDASGHTIQTDLPKRMGGMNCAPQPVEYLLAAWAGCTQATAFYVSRHLKVPLNSMEFINITAIRDETGALTLPIHSIPSIPSRIHTITGIIYVWFPVDINEDDFQLLQEQTEIRCPIANMLTASGCHMDVQWIQKKKKNLKNREQERK